MTDTAKTDGPAAVRTILLLPHESTRAALLAPGAPMYDAGLRRFGWAIPGGWSSGDGVDQVLDADCHIVLARDGAEVYEGTDRLRRVLAEHVGVRTSTGSVVFQGAHGDGSPSAADRWTNWTMHDWSSADCVQFYGRPEQAWPPDGPHKTIHVPALAAPPWPAKPRHPLLTVWALALCAQAQGLGTLLLLDAEGRELAP